MALVIFIVSFTLLIRLCISLIFAILSPALPECLRRLYDLFDQFIGQHFLLLDLTPDLRMRGIKVGQHIRLELFYLLFINSKQHLVGCRAERDHLLVQRKRMVERLFQEFHQAAAIIQLFPSSPHPDPN